MKSFLAHTLFGLSFLSAAAVARPATKLEAHLVATGVSQYQNADVSMDYQKRVLELALDSSVDFRFTRVVTSKNNCGVITSTGIVDKTPVDGARTEVNLHDNRGNTCPTFAVLPAITMTVTQKHYDRINGQWVENTSSFAQKTSPYQGVIRAELDAVNNDRYQGGNIYVDAGKGQVNLSLQPKMPACQPGKMCIQVMPAPVSYELADAETVIDHCGIIRTVAFIDQRPVDGIFLKVTVNNNRNNTCPTFAPLAALDVIVEQVFYSRLEGKEIQTIDSFTADDVALIKPAGK